MIFWIVAAVLVAVYLFLAVRYARQVKGKQEAYSAFDWAVLLLLWWAFWMLDTPVPLPRILVVLFVSAAASGILGALS